MSTELTVFTIMGYILIACFTTAFWSRIPPRDFGYEVSIGILWPIYLLSFFIIAFINSVVRALHDQNGEFAGLAKNTKWVKERNQKKEG